MPPKKKDNDSGNLEDVDMQFILQNPTGLGGKQQQQESQDMLRKKKQDAENRSWIKKLFGD